MRISGWISSGLLPLSLGAESHHFLMPTATCSSVQPDGRSGCGDVESGSARLVVCAVSADAGIVPRGVTKGERMDKARHTAGQRILDATGNPKAVQEFLGHASIATTGDVYVVGHERLAADIAKALEEDYGHDG